MMARKKDGAKNRLRLLLIGIFLFLFCGRENLFAPDVDVQGAMRAFFADQAEGKLLEVGHHYKRMLKIVGCSDSFFLYQFKYCRPTLQNRKGTVDEGFEAARFVLKKSAEHRVESQIDLNCWREQCSRFIIEKVKRIQSGEGECSANPAFLALCDSAMQVRDTDLKRALGEKGGGGHLQLADGKLGKGVSQAGKGVKLLSSPEGGGADLSQEFLALVKLDSITLAERDRRLAALWRCFKSIKLKS